MSTIKQQHTLDERQIPNDKAQEPLLSESYVPQTMPSILGSFDMTAMFVCALFLLTMVSIGISRGVASLTYIVVSCIVFFVPCVIATAQLGIMFPSEGSLYTWTYKVLGSSWSLFIGLCSLLTGMLAVVTSAHIFVVILQAQNNAWLTEPWQQGMVILVIIGIAGLIGLQRARTTHYVINGLVLLIFGAVLLVGLSVAIWLAHGHGSMVDFRRSSDWLVKPDNLSLFGIISLAFLGVAGPLNMAGEIKRTGQQVERKIITRHLLWGALIVLVCYLVITFAVLVVQGPTVLPFDAFTVVHVALGGFASDIAVICFGASFLAAAIFYMSVSARTLMVLGIDGRLSVWFARLNKHRIPSHAVIFQTLFAAGYTIIMLIVAPYVSIFGGTPATRLLELFTINTATMVVIWTIVTLFLFVTLLLLSRRNPLMMSQQRLLPMPLLWGSALVGLAACILVIGAVLFNSWIPQLIVNSTWLFVVGGLSCAYLAIIAVWSMSHFSERDWEA
jgi:amino acid transporter